MTHWLTNLIHTTLPHLNPNNILTDTDTTKLVLEEAQTFSTNTLAPLRHTGDQEGCALINGRVKTPQGSIQAWNAMRENGWTAMGLPESLGGSALNQVLRTAIGVVFSADNQAFMMTQGLTQGAADLLLYHQDGPHKDLITQILTEFSAGTMAGTMNLTEPQCGTDLGLITTKAIETEHGFAITGQKIWISSGDQDLTQRIAHLVLAREPGLDAGMKGISLFLVPTQRWENGNWTTPNTVSCIGLEHKMGLHASPTCVMQYDQAWGVRLGEPGKGLRQMFVMMNAARLLVAGQGLAGAMAAHRHAKAFANDRRAGRGTPIQDPTHSADRIIVHPDVKRMLLEQETFIEAAWLALLWGASLMESKDPTEQALLGVLIPVLKSTLTDQGLQSALTAQQLMGGFGFVRDGKVESIVRDLRITTVYEGTNGIQALDLIGRKLMAQNGAGTFAFISIAKTAAKGSVIEEPLLHAIHDLESSLEGLMTWGMKNPNRASGVAVDVQALFGLVLLGTCWAVMSAQKPESAQFWASRFLSLSGSYKQRILNSSWVDDITPEI